MEINELKSFVNDNLARGLNVKQIAYKLAMDTTDLLDKINSNHDDDEQKTNDDNTKNQDNNYIFGSVDYTGAATDKGEYKIIGADLNHQNTDDGFDPLDD